MPVLFCNIGWMKNYDGIANDSIERGGEYNAHSTGHEVCNFSDCGGKLYGYVQPTGDTKIERLGASKRDESVSGVTVVWTAGPPGGGTAVIGWYRNATVYRKAQEIPKPTARQKENGVSSFRVTALTNDAVLLPVDERLLLIPRAVKGGIGQSNVWFADGLESKPLVDKILKLMRGIVPEVPPDVEASVLEGNPRLSRHLRRERKFKVVKDKKAAVLRATGRLCCEVCNFDFHATYGEYGMEFCEVHHLTPLSKADGAVKTTLADLAVVCSNCHRIIHKQNPMHTIEYLRKYLKKRERARE